MTRRVVAPCRFVIAVAREGDAAMQASANRIETIRAALKLVLGGRGYASLARFDPDQLACWAGRYREGVAEPLVERAMHERARAAQAAGSPDEQQAQ
ncbi:hypothetical protein [Paraburkholderia sp. MM5477-R1]|uniref:hypothetical protein n=1 Tax=Paraburkholderia sp. MM5477-R1 TaxID=2991062 RepID=UPI003D262512